MTINYLFIFTIFHLFIINILEKEQSKKDPSSKMLFTFSGTSPKFLTTAHDWAAKASFSSNKSTSSIFQLALWS